MVHPTLQPLPADFPSQAAAAGEAPGRQHVSGCIALVPHFPRNQPVPKRPPTADRHFSRPGPSPQASCFSSTAIFTIKRGGFRSKYVFQLTYVFRFELKSPCPLQNLLIIRQTNIAPPTTAQVAHAFLFFCLLPTPNVIRLPRHAASTIPFSAKTHTSPSPPWGPRLSCAYPICFLSRQLFASQRDSPVPRSCFFLNLLPRSAPLRPLTKQHSAANVFEIRITRPDAL